MVGSFWSTVRGWQRKSSTSAGTTKTGLDDSSGRIRKCSPRSAEPLVERRLMHLVSRTFFISENWVSSTYPMEKALILDTCWLPMAMLFASTPATQQGRPLNLLVRVSSSGTLTGWALTMSRIVLGNMPPTRMDAFVASSPRTCREHLTGSKDSL